MKRGLVHLSALLRNHDCVIVPGLGGLLCSYRSASIHPTQHIFNAPSRNILFNKNLQTDDGLLTHALAAAEQVSMREAKAIIEKEVAEIQDCLKMGKNVKLDGIGVFMLDVEKNIRFVQSDRENYLNDSFGLFSFQTQPVQRQTVYTRPVPDAAVKGIKTGKGRKIRWTRVALIPLLALLAYLPFSPVLRNASNLNVFPDSENNSATKATYLPRTSPIVDSPENTSANETQITQIDLSDGSMQPIELNFSLPETTATAIPDEVTKTASEASSLQAHAAIITGCFAVYRNAEHQVQMLRQKGIEAEIIGKNASGLFRTGVKISIEKTESQNLIERIKTEVPGAWTLML